MEDEEGMVVDQAASNRGIERHALDSLEGSAGLRLQ